MTREDDIVKGRGGGEPLSAPVRRPVDAPRHTGSMERPVDLSPAAACAGLAIRRASRAVSQHYDQALRYRDLAVAGGSPGAAMAVGQHLAKAEDVPPGCAHRVLKSGERVSKRFSGQIGGPDKARAP